MVRMGLSYIQDARPAETKPLATADEVDHLFGLEYLQVVRKAVRAAFRIH